MAAVSIDRVVVDACTLFHRHPRALIVTLAQLGAFRMYLSPEIINELGRHLIPRHAKTMGAGATAHFEMQIKTILDLLDDFDAGGAISGADVAKHEPHMTNDAKDRHVLAAAVAVGAGVVLTDNKRHFHKKDCVPVGVEALKLDPFFLRILDQAPDVARDAIRQMGVNKAHSPWRPGQVLLAISEYAPRFAAAAAAKFGWVIAARSPA